jgi:hypothetical protein
MQEVLCLLALSQPKWSYSGLSSHSPPPSTALPESLHHVFNPSSYPSHRPHSIPHLQHQVLARFLPEYEVEMIHSMDVTNCFLAFPKQGKESQTKEEMSKRKSQREGVLELCHNHEHDADFKGYCNGNTNPGCGTSTASSFPAFLSFPRPFPLLPGSFPLHPPPPPLPTLTRRPAYRFRSHLRHRRRPR